MEICQIPGLPEDREGLYQKESLYNHYLPYHDQLDEDSDIWWAEIKTNLTRAVLTRDLRPGVVTWMSRLTGFINMYGFKFSKEDHVMLVNLTWSLLTMENMEPRLMEVFVRVLLSLLKKRRLLNRDDLGIVCLDIKDFFRSSFCRA